MFMVGVVQFGTLLALRLGVVVVFVRFEAHLTYNIITSTVIDMDSIV